MQAPEEARVLLVQLFVQLLLHLPLVQLFIFFKQVRLQRLPQEEAPAEASPQEGLLQLRALRLGRQEGLLELESQLLERGSYPDGRPIGQLNIPVLLPKCCKTEPYNTP